MTIELDKEYQWNQGWASRFANSVDVKKVVSELREIEEVHGKLTPELIVDSSKNKKSVLHPYFEWDNEKAANKWRMKQATSLLSRIEVVTIKDGESKIIKVFELTQRTNGYAATSAVYSSSSSSSKFIIQASIEDLNRVKNKLVGHELNSPIEHIDAALKELYELKSTESKEETKPVLSMVG